MKEEALSGGTVASVVRVGDTVRRSTERWSPAVHALLRHLEAVGFDGSPRLLGVDGDGREVLGWIEGAAATRPWPEALRTDDGVRKMAALLRRFHDAVADFVPDPSAEWWTGQRARQSGEIIIHGDLGPWNSIWRGDQPVAFIDWDFAEPAPPIVDVAEMAFFVTPIRDDAHCRECGFDQLPDRRRRLHTFLEAYGEMDVSEVLDEMERYWERDIHLTSTLGPRDLKPWAGFLGRGLVEVNQALLDWLRAHRQVLE